ncbi:putative dsRNA-binding protein [Streptomyces sp. NPDC090106]|uniref:putative dsRNA-binding protein n=1 Tax=Streptomyces sp. NPDC090106 TaxID=3365946 RepID=UPI0037FF849D
MNRWVGVVALRETAVPTPVHRIALAIEAARRRTSYTLGGREIPYARVRAALRRISQKYDNRFDADRWQRTVDAAGEFFDGSEPPGLPSWLVADLRDALDPPKVSPPRQRTPSARSAGGAERADSRRARAPHRRETAPARPAGRAAQRPAAPAAPAAPRVERRLAVNDVAPLTLAALPEELVTPIGAETRAAVARAVDGWEAGPETTAWLGLAAQHRSRLYESGFVEEVSPYVLGLLDRIGATTLHVIVLDAYAHWAYPAKSGDQAVAHAKRRRAAELALAAWAVDGGVPRMGAGEAQNPAPSVAEGVARQILGVLSLTGAHDIARRLVAAVWPDLDRPSADAGPDPVNLAMAAYGKDGLTFHDDGAEGPDHQRVFQVVARMNGGRGALGVGRSKKAARLEAARALLAKYPPRTKGGPAPAGPSAAPPRTYRAPGAGHRDAVADLDTMFELGHRADALLAQSLTHSSWAYENPAALAAAHQRANDLLAHHGSFVIDHLAAHTRARAALAHDLRLDEDDTRLHNVSDPETARLGGLLALWDGLLTGHGEREEKVRAVSDATQAVVASAWRVRGPELLRRRPAVLDEWLTGLDHEHDPVTLFGVFAAAYGMTYEFEDRAEGPDHLRTYITTAVLRDTAGRTSRWTVRQTGHTGKTAANKATAQGLLDLLAATADESFDTLEPHRRDLVSYLLRAQFHGLGPLSERQRGRALARGDLGLDLLATGDLDAYLDWAARVSALLGPDVSPVPEPVRALYRRVVDDTRRGPRSPLRRAGGDPGTDPASAVRRHAASAVRRALDTAPEDLPDPVRDIVQDWWRRQAPETGVTVRDLMRRESFTPLRVQLGALRETLTWCGAAAGAADTPVDVELTVQDGTLHAWIGLHGVDARAACDAFARLLSHALPYTDCLVDDDHVLLRLHSRPDPAALGPLAAAGLAAYLGEDTGPRHTDTTEPVIEKEHPLAPPGY